jgi:molybdenum cofactor cytidylyltransferase
MPDDFQHVYTLILAAGGSTRMGRPKQLLRWQGRTLLDQAIDSACQILPGRVIVILGAHAELIREAINLDSVKMIQNTDWKNGIASSIRQGMKALPATAEAVLVMLCDQPLVDSAHLKALLSSWRSEPERIVASQYHLTSGVPVVFPAAYFGRLRSLSGDKGAKALLAEFDSCVLKIPFAGAGLDIDTPTDFEQLTGQAFAEE